MPEDKSHCFIKRILLQRTKTRTNKKTKILPGKLDSVHSGVVRIFNYVKANVLNSGLFTSLCGNMITDNEQLFLSTKDR